MRRGEHGRAIRPRKGAGADNEHRTRRVLQHGAEAVPAGGRAAQGLPARSEMVVAIAEFMRLAYHAHLQAARQPALSDPRIEDRRLPTRIAADQQQRIGLFDTLDGGVEEIAGTLAGNGGSAILPAVQMRRTEGPHEILERLHRLGISLVAGNGADIRAGPAFHPFPDCLERFAPARRMEPAVAAHIRPVQTLAPESVMREAALVAQPLLVHLFVEARQDTQHFRAP